MRGSTFEVDSSQTSVIGFFRGQRRPALLFLLLWSGFAVFEVVSDWYSLSTAGWPFSLGRYAGQSAFIFYTWFLLSLAIGVLIWLRRSYLDTLRGYLIHAALAVVFGLLHLLNIVASFWFFFPAMLARSSFVDLFIEQFLNWFHFELLVYFAVLFIWQAILQRGAVVSTGRQRVVGRMDGEVHITAPRNIDWIEGANNHVVVHAGIRQIKVRETLKSLEARLDAERLVRVHRCALINVDRLHHIEGARLVMANGDRVAFSQFGKRTLRQFLSESRRCGSPASVQRDG